MRISIALCTWNGATYLRPQLASLAAQTRPIDELIVCDDASDDDTVAIVEEFARGAPFSVALTRNPVRLGVVKNFERAIVKCSGDLIFLCDQDDLWHPDKIALLLRAFDSDDGLGAIFTNARLAGGTTLWDHIGFSERERRLVAGGRAFDVLAGHNVVTGATLAFRDRWREAVLPIPEVGGMLHDHWIGLVISGAGRLAAMNRCLIDYRQHADQLRGTGPAAGGMRRWVQWARRTGPGQYANRAAQLEALLPRLERLQAASGRLESLRERIAHLKARASLPERLTARVPLVARELASLRYLRYSNHLWSAAKDLFW